MVSSVYIVFAVYFLAVTNGQSVLPGSCPDIPPLGGIAEPKEGDVYYRLYTSVLAPLSRCIKDTITKADGDKFKAEISGYDSSGKMIILNIDFVKTGEGRYRVTSPSPDGEGTVQNDIVLSVERKDYAMSYSCENLPDGKYREKATLYSRSKTIPGDIVQKFNDYLKEKGSKLDNLLQVPQDDCPSE